MRPSRVRPSRVRRSTLFVQLLRPTRSRRRGTRRPSRNPRRPRDGPAFARATPRASPRAEGPRRRRGAPLLTSRPYPRPRPPPHPSPVLVRPGTRRARRGAKRHARLRRRAVQQTHRERRLVRVAEPREGVPDPLLRLIVPPSLSNDGGDCRLLHARRPGNRRPHELAHPSNRGVRRGHAADPELVRTRRAGPARTRGPPRSPGRGRRPGSGVHPGPVAARDPVPFFFFFASVDSDARGGSNVGDTTSPRAMRAVASAMPPCRAIHAPHSVRTSR